MDDLKAIWRRRFGDLPPLGHVLRDYCHERWLRFYALPEGKRYADTEGEVAEILRRANAIAGELFKTDEAFWLVSEFRYDDTPPSLGKEDWTWREDDTAHAFKAAFRGSFQHWRHECLDPVFLAISQEHSPSVVFNSESGGVLAPYDGGFDLICPDVSFRLNMRDKFPTWLSPRSDGL